MNDAIKKDENSDSAMLQKLCLVMSRTIADGARITPAIDDRHRWIIAVEKDGKVFRFSDLIERNGIINEPAPLWKIPISELHDVITTNALGTCHSLQAFVPAMVNRAKGLIITLSSGWGRSSEAEVAPYCASNWAIEGLTLSLAKELPAGMAAVTLNPGIVRTDMLRKCWPGRAEEYDSPGSWANRAAQFILRLSASDNGSQLTVPGV